MAIIFDQTGDGSSDLRGRKGWLKGSEDYIQTEYVAKKLMEKAAHALSESKIVQVRIWCSAVNSAAESGVLRVYKGLHKLRGRPDEILHLTMDMRIPGSKQHSLVPYTLFAGAFHLDAKVSESSRAKSGYRLQPIRLSYVPNIGHKQQPGIKEIFEIQIQNAGSVSGEPGQDT